MLHTAKVLLNRLQRHRPEGRFGWFIGVDVERQVLRILLEIWVICGDARTCYGSIPKLARFLKTIVLGHHLERLPESEREHFAAIVAARLAQRGELVVDYLRLNILAKREVTA